MAYPHLKVEEEGKMKVLPQKLTGSRRMVALTPKQEEEVASTKVTGTAAAKKVNITCGVMATKTCGCCLMLMSV